MRTSGNFLDTWQARGETLATRESAHLHAVFSVGQGLRTSSEPVRLEPDPHGALTPELPLAPGVCVRCILHPEDDVTSEQMKALHALALSRTAFELVRDGDRISVQHVICPGAETETLGYFLVAFPNSVFICGAEDVLRDAVGAMPFTGIVECQLSDYPARCLETRHPIPPLARFCAFFESRWADGIGGVQVLYERCRHDWHGYYRWVSLWRQQPGTGIIAPLLPVTAEIEAKMTPALYAVAVRIFASDETTLVGLHRAFVEAFSTNRQRLVWKRGKVELDELLERRARSEGMLLNEDELAALASFPSRAVRSSLLERAQLPHVFVPGDFTEKES